MGWYAKNVCIAGNGKWDIYSKSWQQTRKELIPTYKMAIWRFIYLYGHFYWYIEIHVHGYVEIFSKSNMMMYWSISISFPIALVSPGLLLRGGSPLNTLLYTSDTT